MIKHINPGEISILKDKLKHISEIKQVLKKRKYKSKLDIANQLKKMKILNDMEVENYIKSKDSFIIKKYQKNKELYYNLSLMQEFRNKVSTSNINRYKNKELTFAEAIEIYLAMSSFTLLKQENLNDKLFEYFTRDNTLNEDILNDIKKLSFRYVKDYSDEEYDQRLDNYFEDLYPPDVLDSILEFVCNMVNVKFEKEFYFDIIFNLDKINPCYTELSESCIPLKNDYKDCDDPYDGFISSFGENPYVYCFKGMKISEHLTEAINSKVRSYDNGGFASEIFLMGNNTYLTISEGLFLDILDEDFLLLIICFLLNEGGKLNAN